jgi:hypothetical protein
MESESQRGTVGGAVPFLQFEMFNANDFFGY